jgi:hypothetical protein
MRLVMAETEPIELSFQHTIDDFLHAHRYYRTSFLRAELRKPLTILLTILWLLSTIWMFGTWTISSVGFYDYILLSFFAGFFSCVMLVRALEYRRFYRDNQNAIEQHYDVVIDESGISKKSSTLEDKRSWEGHIGLMESDRAFLLFHGKSLYTIYPKRAFYDESQQCRFRALATEKIGGRR